MKTIQFNKLLSPPKLSADEIHIYLISLNHHTLLQQYPNVLCDVEKQRAARFKFEKHRRAFIIARTALRVVLARYLNQAPDTLEFTFGRFAKPAIAGLEFNLSHSGELMLLAISQNTNLGVDIESIQRDCDIDGLARTSFSEKELQSFVALTAEQKTMAFFNAWTRKEAVIKALGEGIHFGLQNFSVSLAPDDEVKLLEIKDDDASQWQLHSFIPHQHYQAAIAWRGGERHLKFLRIEG